MVVRGRKSASRTEAKTAAAAKRVHLNVPLVQSLICMYHKTVAGNKGEAPVYDTALSGLGRDALVAAVTREHRCGEKTAKERMTMTGGAALAGAWKLFSDQDKRPHQNMNPDVARGPESEAARAALATIKNEKTARFLRESLADGETLNKFYALGEAERQTEEKKARQRDAAQQVAANKLAAEKKAEQMAGAPLSNKAKLEYRVAADTRRAPHPPAPLQAPRTREELNELVYGTKYMEGEIYRLLKPPSPPPTTTMTAKFANHTRSDFVVVSPPRRDDDYGDDRVAPRARGATTTAGATGSNSVSSVILKLLKQLDRDMNRDVRALRDELGEVLETRDETSRVVIQLRDAVDEIRKKQREHDGMLALILTLVQNGGELEVPIIVSSSPSKQIEGGGAPGADTPLVDYYDDYLDSDLDDDLDDDDVVQRPTQAASAAVPTSPAPKDNRPRGVYPRYTPREKQQKQDAKRPRAGDKGGDARKRGRVVDAT